MNYRNKKTSAALSSFGRPKKEKPIEYTVRSSNQDDGYFYDDIDGDDNCLGNFVFV